MAFSVKEVVFLTEKLYASVDDNYVKKLINTPKYKRRMISEIYMEIRENPNLLDHHRLAKYMVDKDLWPMCGLEKEKDNTELKKHLTFI